MSVGLYCRVSTEEQAASGFSIDHQQSRLMAFCESQGWNEYALYIDDGYTGTNLNRPQMQRMIADIENGKIDTVLVYKLDRLSRHQKDVLYLLEDLFESHNIIFKSATEPFDTSTPLGRAMIGILAVFGQLERDTIVERTKSGKSERTKQGLWYGGPVPFGYEWSAAEQILCILPEQAILVQSAFEQFLQGHSYRSIGNWLSTKTNERKYHHHKSVIYLISNPIYTGCLQHKDKLIEHTHEAIITKEIFKMAQAEQERRRKTRSFRSDYPLSHILFCAECGSSMIHIQTTDKRGARPRNRGYYVCSAKHKKSTSCKSQWWKDKILEKYVIQEICAIELNVVTQCEENEPENSSKVIESLKKRLSLLDKKLDKWYQNFEAGTIPFSKLKEHIKELENARGMLAKQIDHLQTDRTPALWERGAVIQEKLATFWPYFTEEEQRDIIYTAISRILVGANQALSIEWNE